MEIFVLDEADRMLDMGFIHDVRRVLKLLPQKKQTLFFSATMPPEVMDLVNGLLHDSARGGGGPRLLPGGGDRASRSTMWTRPTRPSCWPTCWTSWISTPPWCSTRTKHGANRVAQDLNESGHLRRRHPRQQEPDRPGQQALSDFKAGRVRVLVATDIAARGIDIEELGCVFNYNLPDVPETYVHRIGRTGRAGRGGIAISFCQFDEKDELKGIEKLLGKPIPVVEDHPFPMENFDPPQKDKHGRPVNAEDAEARAAARERRLQRVQEAKAKAQPAAVQEPPTPQEGEEALSPAKKRRRRRKKSGAGQAQDGTSPSPAAQAREPEPVHERARPLNRGVRQGRLQDTMPNHPSMPSADFYKPNPLDSDVIMDATARLLAPRRPVRPEPPSLPGGSKRGNSADRSRRPASQSQRKDSQKQAQKEPAKPKQAKAEAASQAGAAQTGQKKKKRRRNDRPRPLERSLYAAHQKDSTEQHSLMRPYYLSHDDD